MSDARIEFKPIVVSSQDAQLIALRRFMLAEICRVIVIPPALLSSGPRLGDRWGS